MNLKKISMVLFIVGFLIAVFSGSFNVLPEMQIIRIVALVFLGVIVGLLNISENQERDFLISSIVFIICSKAIISAIENLKLLSNLSFMLNNLILFIAPAAIMLSLKNILVFASESEIKIDVNNTEDKKKRNIFEMMWDVVLLISVSFVFIILILESFFDISKIQTYVSYVDLGITLIFVIDLIVLFRKSKNLPDYIKSNWIDIVAVLPLGEIFRLAKVIRAVRIIKIVSRAEKISKVTKLGKASSAIAKSNKSLKFFSGSSGFNEYVNTGENYDSTLKKSKLLKKSKKNKK